MASRLDSQRERFEADPSDGRAFQSLEEHYFLEGSWEALARVYEIRIAALDPAEAPRERAGVLFRFGQALEEGFGNLERASDCYREALELDAELEPARRRLRQVSLSRGDLEGALGLLEQEARRSPRPEQRVRLQLEIGELCLGEGADPARAVEAYEAVLTDKPDCAEALIGRAKAFEALALGEAAARAWSEAVDQLEGEAQAEAYAALIETLEPGSDQVIETYWRAHAARAHESRWVEGLAGSLTAAGRWDEAATLGEERIARARGAERRAEIAIELGRLASEHLDDVVSARRWFARAAEWHESADLHIALAEIAVSEADESLRASHLARAMELDSDRGAVAAVAAAPTEMPSALQALRERALAAPEDPGAQRALSEGLESAGLYRELVEVLERRLAFCRDGSEERAAILYRIGEIREHELGEPDSAADAYQLCFAVRPTHDGVVDALARVLREMEQLPELAALLAQAAEAVEDRERPGLLCALGTLRRDELGDAAAAVDAFRRALEIDPTCDDALVGLRAAADQQDDAALRYRALAAEIEICDGERLAEIVPGFAELARAADDEPAALRAIERWALVDPQSRAALESLADALTAAGHTEALVETLEQLERCASEDERGAVRRRLGYLHAAEGRLELAVEAWRGALEVDPTDSASAEALIDGLWESGRPGDLVAVFEGEWGDRLRGVRDADPKYAAALEATGRFEDALALRRALCRARPADRDRAHQFEQTARSANDGEALAEALSLLADLDDGVGREAFELERAGLLDAMLHREEEARELYASLVATASTERIRSEADLALVALLERQGDIDALCDYLESRCAALPAREACEAHARVAALAETRLGDVGRARRNLESAVALRPERGDLWHSLAELYDEDAQPAELLRAVEGELAAGPGADRVLSLRLRAARICAANDPERAEQYYRAAHELDPAEPEASAFLVARYDETGRPDQAEALLRRQIDAIDSDGTEDAAVRRNALRRALADRLADSDDAVELLQAALADALSANGEELRAGFGPIAERLATLYANLERRDSYRTLCRTVAEGCSRPAEAARWWERCARAAFEDGDRGAATDAYERALQHAARPEEVRHALIEIYRADGSGERLAELLEAELEASPESAPMLAELADLYQGPLARPERALRHLEALTAIDSREIRWWERALALAERQGDPERVLGLLRGAVEFGPSAGRTAWLEKTASLLHGELGRPDQAIDAYRHLLRAAPDHSAARHTLRELLFARDRRDEGFAVLQSEVERATPDEQRPLVETALELGRDAAPEARRPWIARFEALAGDDSHLLMRAAAAYRHIGDLAACERTLARAARGLREPAALRELHLERAALLAQDGSAGRRIDALEAARAQGPEDPELLRQLDELYSAEQRHRELLGIVEARVALLVGERRDAEARPLLRRMAVLCTEAIAEPGRAAELWCELLDPAAPEIEATRRARVGDILLSAGRHRYWAPIAEAELAEEIPGSPRWLQLRSRLAHVYECQLGRPLQALDHYRALCDAGHATPAQRRSLLRLLLSRGAAGEWARRVEEHLQSEPGDAPAWIALARVREEHLAHIERAADAFARAAKLDDTQIAAWSGVRRTGEILGDWSRVAEALEHLIELNAVPTGPSWRSLGEIALRRLRDFDRARGALERAREIAPDDLEGLRLLREVARAQDDLGACADLYRAEIGLLGETSAESRALWLELATLAGGALCDWERCAEAYARADSIAALDAPQLADWCEALQGSGASDETTRAWAQVFERWCDHPDSDVDSLDHDRLANAWSQLGERDRALRRIERTLEIDPSRAEAWVLAAELRGNDADATEAWRRAAECSNGPAAARYYERAGHNAEPSDLGAAWVLYGAAVEVDPAAPMALAGLARIGAVTGRSADAADAAGRLLRLDIDVLDYGDALRAGAGCALERAGAAGRDRGPWEQARDLCDALLEHHPDDPDALWIRGRAVFALGDRRGARRDLEARLAADPPLPEAEQSLLLEQLGLTLATAGERSAAVGRLREALAIDPKRPEAHRGLTETLELMGRRGEAASAWAAWAENDPLAEARARAERFERAAELCEAGDERADAWLRAANQVDPSYAPTLLLLVQRLVEREQFEDALREADAGLAHLPVGKHTAQVESLRGRILEKQRDLPRALEAYRRAIELDPDSMDDVRAAGRLLRGQGEWEASAALLRSFASNASHDAHCGEALLDLGRLLAGPLEDIPGAVEAYRRARQLAPEREDVRESLADLLAQFPEHRDEAVAEHRALLRQQPLRQRSLRALLTIAEREPKRPCARHGKALLAALGLLSSFERDEGEPRLEFQIGRDTGLDGEIAASLQKGAQFAAPYCEALLPEHEISEARKCPVAAPVATFREAFFAAEAERLGPGWLALPPESAREVLAELIRASQSNGDTAGPLRDAPNRVRRRVRKALAPVNRADLETFELAGWQRAIELQALAIAVDVTGGALRPALLYALADASNNASLEFGDEVDLSPWLEPSLLATQLVERGLRAWLDSF